MRLGVMPVTVGLARGRLDQSFPFVEAYRFDIAFTSPGQLTDSHGLSLSVIAAGDQTSCRSFATTGPR